MTELIAERTLAPSIAGYRCEVITDFARLQQLQPEWQSLWNASPAAEIFQSFSLARAWWKAYGHNYRLCTIVGYNDSRVVAILPLVCAGGRIQFFGGREFDYNDLLCDEAFGREALAAVLQTLLRLRGWTDCELRGVSHNSQIFRCLHDLPRPLRSRVDFVPQSTCPTIMLGDTPSEIVSTLLRKQSLRRHQNKLGKAGRLSFRHVESASEIESYLPDFFQQHSTRWAMEGQRGVFLNPEPRAFFTAMVHELDPASQLRFSVLKIDQRPIAYHFGFQHNGKFLWYKPTFDVDYWDNSPGEVLLAHLLRYAGEHGIREFDFTVGAEEFKQRFANHAGQTFTIFVSRSRYTVGRCARTAKANLRAMPHVYDFLKMCFRRRAAVRPSTLLRSTVKRLFSAFFMRAKVLVFAVDRRRINPFPPTSTLAQGTMRNLAALAAQEPKYANGDRMQLWRERLKSGDKVYLGCDQGGISSVVWAGSRTEMALSSSATVGLGTPSVVIYEPWARAGKAAIPQVVAATAIEILENNQNTAVWFRWVRDGSVPSAQEFIGAGLQFKYRFVEIRMLRRAVRRALTRISASNSGNASPSTPDPNRST